MTPGGYRHVRETADRGYDYGTVGSPMAGAALGSLRPLRLLVHGVGPFRGSEPTVVPFLARQSTAERVRYRPCDVLVVCGDNGTGKSALLNAIHGLFDLLSTRPTGIFSGLREIPAYPAPTSTMPSVRLDMSAICSIDGHARRVLVTLWHGGDEPPDIVDDATSLEGLADGRDRVLIGFACGTKPASGMNAAGWRVLRTVRAAEGMALIAPSRRRAVGASFAPLPTAMLFNDGRSWDGLGASRSAREVFGYRPAPSFDLGGGTVSATARRLSKLDPSTIEALLKELSDAVFLETSSPIALKLHIPRRIAVDRDRRHMHGLGGLGAGESALFAVHANGWLHMTTSTLLMIDDLDGRIARRWHDRVCVTTLRLALGPAGAMLILTSRDARFANTLVSAADEVGLTCMKTSLNGAVI